MRDIIIGVVGFILGFIICLFINPSLNYCESVHLQHPEYDGYYSSDPPVMCIFYDNLTNLEVKYIISHEFGHWYWYHELNSTIREEWLSMDFTEFPTDYAKTDSYENFAESFAYNCFNLKLPEKQRKFFYKYNFSC